MGLMNLVKHYHPTDAGDFIVKMSKQAARGWIIKLRELGTCIELVV